MKTILCYGDSNTWGRNPEDGSRYGRYQRWPGVLQKSLGEEFYVIEEGLPGRTTVWDDPIEEYKNGKMQLIPILNSHMPIDLVIIVLGTNDLKVRFSVTAADIAAGVARLVKMVQQSPAGCGGKSPLVLLVAPPVVLNRDHDPNDIFFGAGAKSTEFGRLYSEVAKEYGTAFLDGGAIVESSSIDGVHLSREAHEELGASIAAFVRSLIQDGTVDSDGKVSKVI